MKNILMFFVAFSVSVAFGEPVRSMLGSKASYIPTEEPLPYARTVDYLEVRSQGAYQTREYISLGFEMTDGMRFVGDFLFVRNSSRQLMGANASRQYFGVNANGYIEFGILGAATSTVQVDGLTRYLVVFCVDGSNNEGYVCDLNGDVLWSGRGPNYSLKNNFEIFRIREAATLNFVAGNRIYGFEVWLGDELIHEYKPVIDFSGVPCLYDTVGGELLYTPVGRFRTNEDE